MTVNQYIAKFPKDIQKILKTIRATVRKTAPGSEELISYRVPTYKVNGHPIFYFAAFKDHIGLYPMTGPVKTKFKKEVARYKGGKGTIQLPLDEPIPYDLVRRIVKFKMQSAGKPARPKTSAAARARG